MRVKERGQGMRVKERGQAMRVKETGNESEGDRECE